jgi:hypothetical protein
MAANDGHLSSFSSILFSSHANTRRRRLKGWRGLGFVIGSEKEQQRENLAQDCSATMVTCLFFLFIKLAKPISPRSELQIVQMSSQTKCVWQALRIYGLKSSIRALYKNSFFCHSLKLLIDPFTTLRFPKHKTYFHVWWWMEGEGWSPGTGVYRLVALRGRAQPELAGPGCGRAAHSVCFAQNSSLSVFSFTPS